MATSADVDALSAIASTAVLNCVSTPLLLLRSDGLIVYVNIAGNQLLRGNADLRKSQSRLVGRRSDDIELLAAAITRVANSLHPETLCLAGEHDRVSLVLTVAPVRGTPLLAVCIIDLQPSRSSLTSSLRTAFGLSPQSAELAENLMHGLSLAEFSAKTGVTLATVRTRLKALFKRTGSKSQAALVATLWRAVAGAGQPLLRRDNASSG